MEPRYTRNCNALTPEEVEKLHQKRVCVVGVGGLGGYVIESLARVGVGYITMIDRDSFEESNLNRQLFATEDVIGKTKVLVAAARIQKVNSNITINPCACSFGEENAHALIDGHDVVVDALDSIEARFLLQDTCKTLHIPMVHGSIGGWYGQVCTILPGQDTLQKLYPQKTGKGTEQQLGNLPFTAATVGAVQASEVVKLLLSKGEILNQRCLRIDLQDQEFVVTDL